MATPWTSDIDWPALKVGDIVTHNGKKWSCVQPAWGITEPGSQNSQLGWFEVVEKSSEPKTG